MTRSGSRRRGPRDLGTRLLVAIIVVVLVGAATAWVVASAVGPVVFHAHMARAGATSPDAIVHAERAFRTASTLTLAFALLTALVASVVVSIFLTRRITRSLNPVTHAAGQIAAGDYSARVPDVDMGVEFDDLTDAFNTMATDLARIEHGRSQMLGDLAHEMRTPVSTLGAYLEAIAEGHETANPSTVAMLRDQVTRLARLSEDIALVTTAEEGRLSMRRAPVAVAQVVRAATAQAAAGYAEDGIDLALRVAPLAEDVVVDADADRLSQVLTNLLDNARRYTPTHGHVTVTADRSCDTAVIIVSDDGDGIAEEHMPHLFDRFYRVDTARDRTHGGSGIGLSIARAITEAHGGAITAHSDGPGRGARFTVTLPTASTHCAGT